MFSPDIGSNSRHWPNLGNMYILEIWIVVAARGPINNPVNINIIAHFIVSQSLKDELFYFYRVFSNLVIAYAFFLIQNNTFSYRKENTNDRHFMHVHLCKNLECGSFQKAPCSTPSYI